MQQLINRIRVEVQNLDPDMVKRACGDFKIRCEKVIASNGGFIEK
jgi:hypothetical protein